MSEKAKKAKPKKPAPQKRGYTADRVESIVFLTIDDTRRFFAAIHEEQDTLYPVAALQHFTERNYGVGLPCPGYQSKMVLGFSFQSVFA